MKDNTPIHDGFGVHVDADGNITDKPEGLLLSDEEIASEREFGKLRKAVTAAAAKEEREKRDVLRLCGLALIAALAIFGIASCGDTAPEYKGGTVYTTEPSAEAEPLTCEEGADIAYADIRDGLIAEDPAARRLTIESTEVELDYDLKPGVRACKSYYVIELDGDQFVSSKVMCTDSLYVVWMDEDTDQSDLSLLLDCQHLLDLDF